MKKYITWRTILFLAMSIAAFCLSLYFDPDRVMDILFDGFYLAADLELWILFVFYPQIILAHGLLTGFLFYEQRKKLCLLGTTVMEWLIAFVSMFRQQGMSLRNSLTRAPVVTLVYFVLSLCAMHVSTWVMHCIEFLRGGSNNVLKK